MTQSVKEYNPYFHSLMNNLFSIIQNIKEEEEGKKKKFPELKLVYSKIYRWICLVPCDPDTVNHW